MEFKEIFNLWNLQAPSYLKKHRLIAPLISNKLLMSRFASAVENGISIEIATEAILEIQWFIDNDEFWRGRRKKQSLPWFFQDRKSDGAPNWCWFYEHRMDRIEDEEEKELAHDKAFKFKQSMEELP